MIATAARALRPENTVQLHIRPRMPKAAASGQLQKEKKKTASEVCTAQTRVLFSAHSRETASCGARTAADTVAESEDSLHREEAEDGGEREDDASVGGLREVACGGQQTHVAGGAHGGAARHKAASQRVSSAPRRLPALHPPRSGRLLIIPVRHMCRHNLLR